MLREPFRIDRGRGDDDLEVGTPGEQLRQIAQDEVDVEAALVRFVDDEGVVLPQHSVALDLGEQNAVRHQLDERRIRRLIGESHLVSHRLADLFAHFLGDALGDGPGCQTTGLCVADRASNAAAQFEADLGDLGRLSRTGLAGDDDDLMRIDGGGDVVASHADRQVLRVLDARHCGTPIGDDGLGSPYLGFDSFQRVLGSSLVEAPTKSIFVAKGDAEHTRKERTTTLGDR